MNLSIIITKLVSWTLQCFDSARFIATQLSNFVNILGKGICKINKKFAHDDKKSDSRRIKYKDCNCFYEHTNFKDNVTVYKVLCCNKNYEKKVNEN